VCPDHAQSLRCSCHSKVDRCSRMSLICHRFPSSATDTRHFFCPLHRHRMRIHANRMRFHGQHVMVVHALAWGHRASCGCASLHKQHWCQCATCPHTHTHTAARDAFLKEPEKEVALARKCDVSDTYMMDGICARASDSVAHATSPSEVDIFVQ
jgi:hypothetical protein